MRDPGDRSVLVRHLGAIVFFVVGLEDELDGGRVVGDVVKVDREDRVGDWTGSEGTMRRGQSLVDERSLGVEQ